jgi:hypothetical protein
MYFFTYNKTKREKILVGTHLKVIPSVVSIKDWTKVMVLRTKSIQTKKIEFKNIFKDLEKKYNFFDMFQEQLSPPMLVWVHTIYVPTSLPVGVPKNLLFGVLKSLLFGVPKSAV